MNRINLICLGVSDLDASLLFYKSLGFETLANEGSAIVFFNNQGSKLELYPIENLAADINPKNPPQRDTSMFSGITLACNVKEKDEVDEIIQRVQLNGGVIVKQPQEVSWGGYSGYFQDLDGYYWEVAYSKDWRFDDNDMLVIDF